MTTYLENYLTSINNLPVEIRRNLTLIRDLDVKSQAIISDIEGLCDSYVNKVHTLLSSDQIEEALHNLQNCVNLSEEKVKIAGQTYQMVDKHIRRLDRDLEKYKHELDQIKQEQQVQLKSKGKKSKAPKRKSTDGTLIAGTEPNIDINPEVPIDPNEPVYCFCQKVFYGVMVGCDNPDCPIEWFHLGCVGLTEPPQKTKWYCPRCREKFAPDPNSMKEKEEKEKVKEKN